MTIALPTTCGMCRELHEIACPSCRGRGLLRTPGAARNEWNLCAGCDGRGRIVCPACTYAVAYGSGRHGLDFPMQVATVPPLPAGWMCAASDAGVEARGESVLA